MPKVIRDIPQDESENAKEGTAEQGDIVYAHEPLGFCVGGASEAKCCFLGVIYGNWNKSQYWVSEEGPPHDEVTKTVKKLYQSR